MPEVERPVVVVGSANVDHLCRVQRRPRLGETVLANDHVAGLGGKGINQAVAAATLAAEVRLVGAVGDEAAAAQILDGLADAGVDSSYVQIEPESPTGPAFVTVTADGGNTIVVAPGTNQAVTADHLRTAAAAIDTRAVSVTPMEIPSDAVAALIATLHLEDRFVLNLAPWFDLPSTVPSQADPLMVEHEARAMLDSCGGAPSGWDPATMPRALAARARSVLITAGAQGAVSVERSMASWHETPPVDVVDSTGAGDGFVGALAAGLARGKSVFGAAGRAVTAVSATVGGLGAQFSYHRMAGGRQ